ncbi:uncharacterized protein LOC121967299 isoform X4 [Zingiber officinale]|uniref:uncharacterized protein LOC121967299 isoform X4 n=1 Tax=Zingiber officinale TaxID=94328 RepID=UPI001C4DCFA7|nr:uncharacterized protein LOC121967299 isoform X4 [Zingiber officinale]
MPSHPSPILIFFTRALASISSQRHRLPSLNPAIVLTSLAADTRRKTRIAPIKAASRSKLPIPPSPDVATLSTDHPSATYLEPHHQCRTPLQRLSRNRELAFIEAEDFVSGLASRCRISGHDRQIKLAGKIFMESPGDPVRQFHVTFEDNLTILDFDRDECRDEIGVGFSLHLEVIMSSTLAVYITSDIILASDIVSGGR